LTKDDFKQTIFVFKALKGLYYYNSGPKAGASQKHKHIQVLPYEARDLPIFQNILQFSQ
jgi:ATP adenylyltransferase